MNKIVKWTSLMVKISCLHVQSLSLDYGRKCEVVLYTVWRSLGYLDWAGVLTKLLLGREFEPRRGDIFGISSKVQRTLGIQVTATRCRWR